MPKLHLLREARSWVVALCGHFFGGCTRISRGSEPVRDRRGIEALKDGRVGRVGRVWGEVVQKDGASRAGATV